jgi:hypothetical protein
MKIIKNKISICILLLLTGASAYCQTDPPDPGEIPPDLPINENINILLLIALLFGFYIIYKHIQNKKASI